MASLLTLVPASAESRVETIVAAEVTVGSLLVAAGRPPDEVDSLAAVSDVRVLADAFDSLSVQAAAFTTDVFRFAHDGGQLLRYSALATGATPAFLVIGLAMPSLASARENAARLRALVESGSSDAARRPWSDLVGVSSIEVQGRVVVAVLSTKVPTLWLSLEREPDSLVWWSD
ncbi:MAG: hypothetical protein QOI95_337 [Acidimicrobiaceae bacterium]